MIVRMLVLDGEHKGLTIKLPLTQFIIGRDRTCHLRPVSESVSKFHCAIGRPGPTVVVRDLNSKNGTLVNDEPITGNRPVRDGDVLRIGPLRFQFQFEEEEADASSIFDSGLEWLIREPHDDERKILDKSSDTQIIACLQEPENPPETEPEPESPSTPRRTSRKSVVGGQFLKDYVDIRKKRRGDK